MADRQAVLGSGAKFSGKITNAKSIEINGFVEADLATEKVTIGSTVNWIISLRLKQYLMKLLSQIGPHC